MSAAYRHPFSDHTPDRLSCSNRVTLRGLLFLRTLEFSSWVLQRF
ncbi:hypothetical protein CPTC_01462 [Corynebacterium pseudotuberculosis]|nr:hypothetical protein CPTC_01462 [Corynebacterium pseudotuberculosis]AKC73667.1 Hypothetical protein Cp226_0940 [Corynebacterium pseudotuberculosis]ATQ65240.1 Hypothetical protein CpPA07_0933 [Corynebacterium pseudotuberculosis]